MKFRKYFFGYIFLFFSLLSTFLGVYYFYLPKKNFANKNENVLGAAIITLNKITNYDIEFTDLDGAVKSIRPKGCIGFDKAGSPGNVDSMKTSCKRDYNVTFPSPPYTIFWNPNMWGINYTWVSLRFKTPDGKGIRTQEIFPDADETYPSIIPPSKPKYRPVLDSINGLPVMFYYGGIHEINIPKNSTYLLTRMYDSEYYSKGFEHGNIPTAVLKLSPKESLYFLNPTANRVDEESCFFCTQTQIYQNTCNTSGMSGKPYCPGLATEEFEWGVSVGGKLFPELVPSTFGGRAYEEAWIQRYASWSFRGDRAQYKDTNNRAFDRYQNTPSIDEVNIEDCGNSKACSTGNPTNKGNLFVASKRTYMMPYSPGYGVGFKLDCIGKKNDNSCEEVIAYGAKVDPPTKYSYTGFRYFNASRMSQVNCSTTTSSTACVTGNELLHNDRWVPYSNITGGYEIPFNTYKANQASCALTGSGATDRCIKAIDWNDSSGKIVTYNSFITDKSVISTFNKPENFPPTNVDFNFTSDTLNFAIKMNPTVGAYGSMDVYRYYLDVIKNAPVSEKLTYYFTAQSPMPKYYRRDEISVTFSIDPKLQATDVDLMFSSLNAKPLNYAPNELRLLRIREGLSRAKSFNSTEILDITNYMDFGGVYPLTFKRYFEDGSKNSGYVAGYDYYVFVASNAVYHSAVPDTSDCNINLTSMNVVNTSPNSLYYGIPVGSVAGQNKVVLDASKGIYCVNPLDGTDLTDKPVNGALITFYDPISNVKINSFAATTITQSKTFEFGGAIDAFMRSLSSGDKLNFDLNFSLGNTNIVVNKVGAPQLFSKGYTIYLESRINLGISQAGSTMNLTDTPMSISVKKSIGNALSFDLNGKSNPVNISSSNFSNFFFDHNLMISGNTLVDDLTYRICFPYKVLSARSSNTNLLAVSVDSINPRCINTRYQNTDKASYNIIPQTISVNLSEVLVPTIGNFEFNGNVYSNTALSGRFIYSPTNKKYEGSYITSGSFNSNYKFLNKALFGMYRPSELPSSLVGFNLTSNLDTPNSYNRFNLLYNNVSYQEGNPISAESYVTLNPVSDNDYEIIAISKGKGVLIDLTDVNIQKDFSKYILVNLDSTRDSRIAFKINCPSTNYDQICFYDNFFNFKGSLLGPFSLIGKLDSTIIDTKVVRIHENPDTLVNIIPSLRSKKYQMVSSSLVNLIYE